MARKSEGVEVHSQKTMEEKGLMRKQLRYVDRSDDIENKLTQFYQTASGGDIVAKVGLHREQQAYSYNYSKTVLIRI